MESSAVRRAEESRSEAEALVEAQAMAEWFPDYLYGLINELPELSQDASERIQQLFGEGNIEAHMEVIRDSVVLFTPEEQEALALYFCGYPDAALEVFVSPDIELEKILQTFSEIIEPFTIKETKSNIVQLRAVRSLDNETPFDDEITPLQDDTPPEQLRGVTLSGDPVHDYLQLIGRYQLLTAEQEVSLSKEIEVGVFAAERIEKEGYSSESELRELQYLVKVGERSKERMLNSNLRLAVSIAKRYRGHGMPFMDIIQEGNKGLIRAVEKFDYQQGYKFSTYATWWVRQSVTRALADFGRDIRVPVHAVGNILMITKAQRELLVELNREPTIEELAEETRLSPEKVIHLLEVDRRTQTISLNTPIGDADEAEFGDLIADRNLSVSDQVQNLVVEQERRVLIDKMMSHLPERDAQVIRLRYGLGKGAVKMTLDEVGLQLGVTRERVRQIETRAFKKMRAHVPSLFDERAFLRDD